jgi:predicted AAA+ superfamily ATPase
MESTYIKRALEPVLEDASSEFPVVILTGPRQSGKTTLMLHLFADRYRYVSLELPDIRASASADPRSFIKMYPPPVIFDEIQYVPDLLPYIKERVETQQEICGQYLLTSSQNLLVREKISESFAGLAALFRLLPLSWRETARQSQVALPLELKKTARSRSLSYLDLWKGFLRGGYPELAVHKEHDVTLWHADYIQTYLEKDIRTLRHVGDLTLFKNFLRALAARSAQPLNLTSLARKLGIAVATVKAWLSLLEATFQVIILRPYHTNIKKRLVKMPKIYFTDVGNLCYLVGLREPEHAAFGPMGSVIMETAVLSEIIKMFVHQGLKPRVYFWRTSAGTEVDFVMETGTELIPVEVKTSAKPRPAMTSSIEAFHEALGHRATSGYIVHAGKDRFTFGSDVIALPFAELSLSTIYSKIRSS